MDIRLRPRPSDPRCAFCHDSAAAARECPACRTILHDDCWVLAGVCPTLGCAKARSLVVRVLCPFEGATLAHLVAWLLAFAAVVAILRGVLPAFVKMFQETGISLPSITELVVACSWFATSPAGSVAAVLVVVGSVAAYRRWRARAALRRAFVLLAVASAAFLILVAYAAFSPLAVCGGCQKL